ncbi:MAG TPA: hypothetical protein VJT80_17900 [Steroidobacteraceae bacterium]|nr:hypothetical protein [Steroidobacteraceae bacterium]
MRKVVAIGCVAVLACSRTAAAEHGARDLQGIWTGGTLTPLERPPNHAEGGTLVVESSNFNGKGWIATGRNWGRLYGVPSTPQLRIKERFTRVDAKTLNYRIYEYACHEGNQAIELILRGARTQERDASG